MLLTTRQAAERLGVSEFIVRAAVRRKELRSFPLREGETKTGRKFLGFMEGDILTYKGKRATAQARIDANRTKRAERAAKRAARNGGPVQGILEAVADPNGADMLARLTEIRDLLARLVAIWGPVGGGHQ